MPTVRPGATAAHAGSRPSSYQYLLDLDIDLADELDVRMRLAARTALTASSTAGLSMAAAHAGALLRRASGAPGLRTPGSSLAMAMNGISTEASRSSSP